jgi:vacuolar iron transporter family protein
MPREQHHRTQRSEWLRAVVLGADDGVISTASLILGVASAAASRGQVLIAGVAALAAGAMSMAAGEYVPSVRSRTWNGPIWRSNARDLRPMRRPSTKN